MRKTMIPVEGRATFGITPETGKHRNHGRTDLVTTRHAFVLLRAGHRPVSACHGYKLVPCQVDKERMEA